MLLFSSPLSSPSSQWGNGNLPMIFLCSNLLWVYFCLPAFRGGGYCNCDHDCDCDCDYYSTLHNSVRVCVCRPALGERTLLYEIFIQWQDPTQHGYTFIYPRLGEERGGGNAAVTVTVTTILRYTILLWVYFYLPAFRRSGFSGSIATATAIVTLHYVILLRVYFCLPAFRDRW